MNIFARLTIVLELAVGQELNLHLNLVEIILNPRILQLILPEHLIIQLVEQNYLGKYSHHKYQKFLEMEY